MSHTGGALSQLAQDISGWSEAAVREQIIAPVLAELGYRTGTANNIHHEETISLRYPHLSLGRKKPGKDPELRGRPDYICEARGVTRWVLEAKPATADISADDIEQAHSYAMHKEIAAPLFVVTNGRQWKIFESFRGPHVPPILDCTYEELLAKPYMLAAVLSPAQLARRFPIKRVDLGRPLSSAFGSSAKIAGGFTEYKAVDGFIKGLPPNVAPPDFANLKALEGVNAAIVGDHCYRSDEKGIVAQVRMHFIKDSMRILAEQMGMDRNLYTTRDEAISEDPESPTIFEWAAESSIQAGATAFDITQGKEVTTPVPMRVMWYSEAIGSLKGDTFSGIYSATPGRP